MILDLKKLKDVYNNCREYLDNDFEEAAFSNDKELPPNGRLWELAFCDFLIRNNYSIVKATAYKNINRPDFCLENSKGNRIWVELVCPEAGERLAPEDCEIKTETYIIDRKKSWNTYIDTITGAIKKKNEQFIKFSECKKSDHKEGDMFLLGINVCNLGTDFEERGIMDLVLKGKDLPKITREGFLSTQEKIEVFKKIRDPKKSLELNVNLFNDTTYEYLEGVFCCYDVFPNINLNLDSLNFYTKDDGFSLEHYKE